MTTHEGKLAIVLAHEQWELEQASYDIAAGRATAKGCAETAGVLERLARELRDYAATLSFGGGQPPTTVDPDDPDEPGGRGEPE
ncbi:hypothetical protein [Actinopolyspora saharensis]|uniref:hypothetical protein n=1 Tax=Actinopolyspora saharensis TaxID=995062 RepID=UPI003F67D69C